MAVNVILLVLAIQSAGTGSLSGEILDPNGAVIPRASVTLRRPASEQSWHQRTDATGRYSFEGLEAGRYYVTAALDSHPPIAESLVSRAEAISRDPEDEVIIIVAHRPTSDDENTLRLQEMTALATLMRRETGFDRIEYQTVRDDAPDPIRNRAAADLRSLVERVRAEGKDALIVPVLLSYGGIEDGIRERLEGLSYRMSPQALLPDERLSQRVMSVVAAEYRLRRSARTRAGKAVRVQCTSPSS